MGGMCGIRRNELCCKARRDMDKVRDILTNDKHVMRECVRYDICTLSSIVIIQRKISNSV